MRAATGIALGLVLTVVSSAASQAQTSVNLLALKGLLPFSTLLNTPAGKAVLQSNFTVTGAIQNGTYQQPGLQDFSQAQAQALRDAFITGGNGTELADGLGSSLGAAYAAQAAYHSTDDGKTSSFTNISPAMANLLSYSAALTGMDSASAKYYFSNETVVTKTAAMPVSPAAAALMSQAGGTTDVYGKAYGHAAGSKGADPLGDSRPYQTEPKLLMYTDPDYFGVTSGNNDYLNGPAQKLTNSPAFPSGHTTYGYTESLLFAVMVPERFTQMVTRGAEYGNNRIILGAHYAMDVIAGRTLASYDLAHLLANDPAYLAQKAGKAAPITNYQAALRAARADLRAALAKACGHAIAVCAKDDTSRFADAAKNQAFYESTQTYGLPVVYRQTAGKLEDVALLAPQAGYLLTTAFPHLTLQQADRILTQTEGPGGGFLNDGSGFGVYSRLDLYKAGQRAAQVK